MYSRVFLDANIFIDANDVNRPSYHESFKIVPYLLGQGSTIYTSCDLITTIYYILAKQDRVRALDSIEQMNRFCNVIPFDNREVQASCDLMRDDGNYTDLEDTLQYILAQKTGCELIISNDTRFYSRDIEVMGSGEFVERYIEETAR